MAEILEHMMDCQDWWSCVSSQILNQPSRRSQSSCLRWVTFRDNVVYALSQWEMTLPCNVVSHWPGACTQNDPSTFNFRMTGEVFLQFYLFPNSNVRNLMKYRIKLINSNSLTNHVTVTWLVSEFDPVLTCYWYSTTLSINPECYPPLSHRCWHCENFWTFTRPEDR